MKGLKINLPVILLVTGSILGIVFDCDTSVAQSMGSAGGAAVVHFAAPSATEQPTKGSEIRSTVKDVSGIKQKLTMDFVKHVAVKLEYYNYPSEYGQVVDGHYYYMRQTKSNQFTVYRDAGKKVGSFKVADQEEGYGWHAFGWYRGKFYLELCNEKDPMIKIAVADFKRKTTRTLCTCKVHPSVNNKDLFQTKVYLYQNKI